MHIYIEREGEREGLGFRVSREQGNRHDLPMLFPSSLLPTSKRKGYDVSSSKLATPLNLQAHAKSPKLTAG